MAVVRIRAGGKIIAMQERRIKRTTEFVPVEEGTHQAVVSDEVYIGLQPGFGDGEPINQWAIRFEVVDELTPDGKPKVIWCLMKESLHVKSKLGRLFVAADRLPPQGGDASVHDVHGANVAVVVEHVKKEDATYANISGFSKLLKGSKQFKPALPGGNMPEWIDRKRQAGLAAEAMEASPQSDPLPTRTEFVDVSQETDADVLAALTADP
jgi:hypothetical protein